MGLSQSRLKFLAVWVALLALLGSLGLRRLRTRSAVRSALKRRHVVSLVSSDGESCTRAALLDAALASPKYVGMHDKVNWLNLFAADGIIEDPVGSPASGPNGDERSLFYDTFIGPNQVTLVPILPDIVAVKQKIVVRNLNIEPQFPNGALSRVPVHAVYRFAQEGEGLVVKSLAAHWEVVQNQPVLDNWRDLAPWLAGSTNAFATILKTRGLYYTLEYLCGTMLMGAGRAEKQTVMDFATAITRGNIDAFTNILAADGMISFPVQDRAFAPSEFTAASGIQKIEFSRLRSGGEFVSCDLIVYLSGGESYPGVGIFEFAPFIAGQIQRVQFFWEGNTSSV